MTIFTQDARLHHATKTKADKQADTLAAEYPILSIEPQYQDEIFVTGFQYIWGADTEGRAVVLTTQEPKVAELADILEACDEAGLDPEELDANFDEQGGSVVDVHYRNLYKEVSTNGQTCGDWLAEWLTTETASPDGCNFEDLEAIFSANGLDLTAKWAMAKETGSRGWKGRYRMNGRQVLEKAVAKAGFVRNAQGSKVCTTATTTQEKHQWTTFPH